jgi:alpha-amylase
VRRCVSGLVVLGVLALPVGAAARTDAPPQPAPPTGAALAALSQPPARTAIARERIYFVMPDRYRNGNTANDRGGVSGARGQTGFDPTDPGWFHGGDYAGLTGDCDDPRRGLARLEELGFTAIWVTPPYKQKYVQGSSAAYHGYWILDFTTVDPHLGTEAEFEAFVQCAHRLGLRVYLDVVVNHTADVILPTGGSGWVDPAEVPYRDCRGRRFDPAAYALKRTFPCLRASTMPRVPHVPTPERNVKRPAWLNDVTRYHNRGDVSFGSCSELCFEMGDFFGLDDLFTEQGVVADGLGKVYGDWIRRFKVDGFRIDTARHVNAAFFKRWIPQIRAAARQAGVKDFEIFGEVFDANAINLSGYVRGRGLPNVLDFALQDAVAGFASGQTGSRGIASRLADDDYFGRPNGIAHTPPTFLGNHDMGRAAQQIKARSQASGDTLVRRVNLGYSLLYLLRGAPVVLYGDEVGMIGSGGDKAARQDMFPTQVSEWKTEERAGTRPVGEGSSFDVQDHPIGTHLSSLAESRELHAALSTGSTHVRLARGPVLVASRFDAREQVEYVLAFNSGQTASTVTVQTSTPSATFVVSTPYPLADRVTSDARGRLTFTIPPLSAVVRNATVSVAPAPAPRPAISAGRAEFADLIEVRARVGGIAPVSVAFAVRRAEGRWARAGVDDSPPYRAMLDPRRFRRGERIHLVAVARGLDGRTTTSRVTPFVVPRRAS